MYADIAQLEEQCIRNTKGTGSNPVIGRNEILYKEINSLGI